VVFFVLFLFYMVHNQPEAWSPTSMRFPVFQCSPGYNPQRLGLPLAMFGIAWRMMVLYMPRFLKAIAAVLRKRMPGRPFPFFSPFKS